MTQVGNSPQTTPKPVIDAAFAFGRTATLSSAIELDLFTQIEDGHDTVASLARATGCSERGLRILLSALSGAGFLEKSGERFALTETAKKFLSKNSPAYLGSWVLHMQQLQPDWSHLTEVVRTGKPLRDAHGGEDRGEFFSHFVDSLYAMNRMPAQAAAEAILFQVPEAQEIQLLDIGAGSGVWGFTFARLHPRVHVTALDWPKVIDSITRRFAKREGLESRVSYLPGNLRELDFGEGQYDVATVGHICHGEGPERTRRLFAKLRRALKPDGHLVIADFIPDEERARAEFPLLFAINMLIGTADGNVFTFGEYRQWLQEAGFGDVHRIEFPGDVALIGAKAAAVARKVA